MKRALRSEEPKAHLSKDLQNPRVIRTPRFAAISDRSAAALRELERVGLVPGTALTVEQRNSAASVTIRCATRKEAVRLGNDLASRILVVANPTK